MLFCTIPPKYAQNYYLYKLCIKPITTPIRNNIIIDIFVRDINTYEEELLLNNKKRLSHKRPSHEKLRYERHEEN